jgi:hypothetical protein
MKTKFDPESSVEQKLEKQENSTITERSMQLNLIDFAYHQLIKLYSLVSAPSLSVSSR